MFKNLRPTLLQQQSRPSLLSHTQMRLFSFDRLTAHYVRNLYSYLPEASKESHEDRNKGASRQTEACRVAILDQVQAFLHSQETTVLLSLPYLPLLSLP